MAYLVPNLNNPDVKAKAIDGFFAGAEALYGHDSKAVSQPKAIELTDDDDYGQPVIDGEYSEAPDASALDAAPNDEPEFLQEEPEPEPEPAQSGAMRCDACGIEISEKVYNYSMSKFNKPLCFGCQKKVGK